jgi:hypothetical protein
MIRLPHFRLSMLMMIVALVAVDFGAIRAIFIYEPIAGLGLLALIQTVPIGLALNYGLIRFVVTKDCSRAFWMGFFVCGIMAMSVIGWAVLTPPGWGPSPTGIPNKIRHESTTWVVWNTYFVFVVKCLGFLNFDYRSIAPKSLDHLGIGFIAFAGFFAILPSITIALLGGLMARSIFIRLKRIDER